MLCLLAAAGMAAALPAHAEPNPTAPPGIDANVQVVEQATGITRQIPRDGRLPVAPGEVLRVMLDRGDVVAVARAGQDLELTLKDGRKLVFEGDYAVDGAGKHAEVALQDEDGLLWWIRGEETGAFAYAEITSLAQVNVAPRVAADRGAGVHAARGIGGPIAEDASGGGAQAMSGANAAPADGLPQQAPLAQTAKAAVATGAKAKPAKAPPRVSGSALQEALPPPTDLGGMTITAKRPPGYVEAIGAQLDWLKAVRIAAGRYPTIAAAVASLRQQGDLVDAARAGYRPRLTAEVSNGNQGDNYGNGQVATLGFTQTLWDFGKTGSAVAQARAGQQRGQAGVLQAIDDVVQSTVAALIEVHREQQLEQVVQAQIAALQKVLDITEMRAQAGAATRSDPIQARSRVQAAQAHLLDVESQLKQWRSRLVTFTGPAVPETVADAPQATFARDADATDTDRLAAVLGAKAQRAQAEAALKNARASRWPTLELDASQNKRLGPAGNRYERIYGRDTYTSVLVALRGSLYQGGAASAQARASASALAAADAQVDTARLQAQDDLSRYRKQVRGLQGRIEVLQQRVDSITETRELYWDQYLSLGTRNVLDLLNAEQEIGQASEDLENARHDLLAAQLGQIVSAGLARDAFGLDGNTVQGVEIAP